MTRRQAAGLLMAALLIAGGRAVRHQLLLDADGSWRDPLWLDQWLPSTPAATTADPPDTQTHFPLHIESCPEQELTHLPGIGPVLAARIAAARASGVHFASPNDLQRVKGIGPILAQRLTPYLRFCGQDADSMHDTLLCQPAVLSIPRDPERAP